MWIRYDEETYILTIRLDPKESSFRNEQYMDESLHVVLDIDGDDRIAGFEILDASKRVNLAAILPLTRAGA